MFERSFKILGSILPAFFNHRRLRVLVHRGYFGSDEECFFVNLTNLSSTHHLEVTDVWFQGDCQVSVLQPLRPLPVRLEPQQSWETWIPVADVPPIVLPEALTLARVRLSNGAVVRSKPNIDVPNYGTYFSSLRAT